MAKRWRCMICGYIHVGETPPYVCPICNAPQKMFELMDNESAKDMIDGKSNKETQ